MSIGRTGDDKLVRRALGHGARLPDGGRHVRTSTPSAPLARPAVALAIATLLGIVPACQGAKSPSANSLVGKAAPEMAAGDAIGEGPKTLAEAKGKITVVDVWSVFCEPCRKSFPKYQALLEEKGDKLAVIGLTCDSADEAPADAIEKFASDTGAHFALVRDLAVCPRYDAPKMPTAYVIDAEGIVRFVHAGFDGSEIDMLSREIDELAK